MSGSAKLVGNVGDGIGLNGIATVYKISDSFSVAQNVTDSLSERGDALGFFRSLSQNSTVGSTLNGFNDFTGLVVNLSGGVTLLTASNTGQVTVLASTTVSSFNNAISHTLSYSVNTSTGTISNILLDGSSVALPTPSSNPFTVAATAYAGIYSSQSSSAGYGTFQNFVVSTPTAVPEPASLGLLAVGGLGLMLLGKRRYT